MKRKLRFKFKISENDVKKYKNKEWLYDKYQNERLSAIKIAKICKAGDTTIYRWLKKFNIHIRFAGEYNLGKKRKPMSEETKRKMSKTRKGIYPSEKTRQKMSRAHKGEKNWNYSKHRSEETKQKIRLGNLGKYISNETRQKMKQRMIGNKYLLGFHPTKETREKQSRTMSGRMPECIQREGKWGNVKRGYFNINGKEMFFRSKWEANYALYLDFLIKHKQIKKWEYESDTFIFEKIRFGTKSYRPDFKIFNDDINVEYHEIKGYMTPKSKTQIKRMAKYYPNIKLIIIDKDIYNDIKKKLGKMLKFY